MKPIDFVIGVRESIISSNLTIYKELFENTKVETAKDPYWIEALKLFKGLNDDEKETFFKIIRQVEVDTVSNLFAVLDGVSWIEGQESTFKLTSVDEDNIIINGSLQDIFLEAENN